jgi:Zn-dependent M28 family amino/carboxypeptidase
MKRTTKNALLALTASMVAIASLITQPFVSAQTITSPAVDAQALQAHVNYLSVDAYPRSADFPQKLNAAADYIKDNLTAAGVTVTEQAYEVDGETVRNLVMYFGPTQGKTLVIGAHYDSHGNAQAAERSGKSHTSDSHTPGADDNASGVAGLMELAKLLQKNPPARPVELVAYTLEEPPYFRTADMGSAQHAKNFAANHPNSSMDLMVSLEMIGYFTDAPDSQDYPIKAMKLLYPNQGNFITVVGRTSDVGAVRRVKAALKGETLEVRSINAPASIAGVDFSDHQNYWALNQPAVMVTDTAFMRNKQYHQAGDTYDKLDYNRMAQVVQGVYRLAQQPL